MAFTFPAAPTVGQVFTSGNVAWQWDGSAWRGTGTSGINILRSDQSGAITGSLTVSSTFAATGTITSSSSVAASGTGGFLSSTYAVGARNPIWRFGNADGYGLSYFQGSSGIGGSDTIGFHFGTATAAASFLQLNQPGTAVFSASVNPSATNTYDLGTSSLRWRNIYTQDLQLSNGIGDYTVVEGEEDLFLYNNKTGKTFKFALIEVDPSTVPPKTNTD